MDIELTPEQIEAQARLLQKWLEKPAKWRAAQEELQRQAEAATEALAPRFLPLPADSPIVSKALNLLTNYHHTARLESLAAALEEAEAEPLGLNSAQRQALRRTAQKLRAWAGATANTTPVGYLTRAQFARLAQVSANTLVKWHAAGSLVPAYTHPLTRYRYYKPEQVAGVRAARQRRQRKAAK